MKILRIYIVFIALLALASLVIQYGFYFPQDYLPWLAAVNFFIAASFIGFTLIKLVASKNKFRHIKGNPIEFIIIILLILQLVFSKQLFQLLSPMLEHFNLFSLTNLYIVLVQGYIFLNLIIRLPLLSSKMANLRFPPSLILLGTFATIIITGTLLLMLPKATHTGIGIINALFTATSATCVTGLIVVNTPVYFTRFGQFVILLMIQLGGIGIMTFASFFALILRGELGLHEKVLLGDTLNFRIFGKLKDLVKAIIIVTFSVEFLGAIFFYLRFSQQDISARQPALWNSIFHSISAFCNAGFSLFPDSFSQYVGDIYINVVLMLLIILGGLGFVVLRDITGWIKGHLTRGRKPLKLLLQTKIVVATSLFLIVSGAVMLLVIGSGTYLGEHTFSSGFLSSFFQSVTARTAGFNTLPIGQLTRSALWVIILLMFIGASPGSTGGGIKTTTFFVLFSLVYARFKGKRTVEWGGRRIGAGTHSEAMVVFFLALAMVSFSIFLLSLTEQFPTEKIIFEVFSAFGTVGLSTGITPYLSSFAKLVIIVTMFVGRLGPLSIVLAIPTKREKKRVSYLEEGVMIG